MKFSLKWLGEFIETSSFFKEPEKLAHKLTQAGLELDSVEDQRHDHIVIAQIESVTKHPQADRLTLCEVKTDQKTYSVVCGAKNHKAGDKVLLTKEGAKLPGGLKIKKSKIRGIESEGMLASKSELGFSTEEEGIWILPESAPLGQSFSEYKGLDDVLFEISIPPNRSDCLSHKGLAREIACLFSLNFKEKVQEWAPSDMKSSLSVKIQDLKACPRYCAGLIQDIEIKESPDWLKKRLQSIGLKSINNVVDITNFILWDQGQPLHAFDRDKIKNIQVGPAQPGEEFLSLDNSVLKLQSEDLVIRDKDKILALAGIIGAMDSSITSQTKNIVIESAYFAPEKIRKTARRLGLETDSSYRFSRGVDPLNVLSSMKRACSLIQQAAGGKIAKDFYDINSVSKKTTAIFISADQVSERLGCSVSPNDFKNWMSNLGCKIQTDNQKGFKVTAPSYRPDLNIKEDLIEEFARLSAYDKIPEALPPAAPPKDSHKDFINSQNLIDFLSAGSWLQCINYSFCDPLYFKDFTSQICYLEDLLHSSQNKKSDLYKKSFSVENPISRTLSLMKPLLSPDLFKNVLYNFRRNNKSGRLFELAPVFYQEEKDYKQELNLALALWGSPLNLWSREKIPNFYKMKSFMESLLKAFQVKSWTWEELPIPFLNPKQTLVLKSQKQKIAYIGSLHPNHCKKYKIQSDVALAEIKADFLLKNKKSLKFKAFSQLSTVEKDLCFDIPSKIPVGEVAKEIQKSLKCKKVEIFDIYKHFVSFRIYLEPKEKSWTDQELQSFLNQAIQAVERKFNIQLKP